MIKPFQALTQVPYLVADTETTGVENNDEVVEIAILDGLTNQFVLDTLVKPTIPIPAEATAVHGITNEMVADAPTWDELAPTIKKIYQGKQVVMYNARFDVRLCWQSSMARKVEDDGLLGCESYFCAMLEYSEYANIPQFGRGKKWFKLPLAAEREGLEVPQNLHRARADTWLTQQLIQRVLEKQDLPPWA